MLLSLIEKSEKLDIVLASTSPRRYEILKNAGLEFRVEGSNVQEDNSADLDADALARQHALLKGQEVAKRFPEALVISADTIVVYKSEVMGKPQDDDDAFRMLQILEGNTHQVITAFSLILAKYDLMRTESVKTDVTFRDLSDEEILAYINTAEPFDKAGAYGIQGQGAMLIEKINGCYLNVVGFPLSKFYVTLEEFLTHLSV